MKENHITDNSIINEQLNVTSISPSDIQVLAAIKHITGKGENAEVRQTKDGTLSVYEVKKSRRI
jgi:mannose-6-phosphate isomerase class I